MIYDTDAGYEKVVNGEKIMAKISDIKYVVISVMGPHAGESENEIFIRKIQDIHNIGRSFWLMKSHQSKPKMVQELCSTANVENAECYCLLEKLGEHFGKE